MKGILLGSAVTLWAGVAFAGPLDWLPKDMFGNKTTRGPTTQACICLRACASVGQGYTPRKGQKIGDCPRRIHEEVLYDAVAQCGCSGGRAKPSNGTHGRTSPNH